MRNENWIITKWARHSWDDSEDRQEINDANENIRKYGNSKTKENLKKYPYEFRCLNDDYEIIFYGLSDDDSSFEALDDFGAPAYGCTDIQYKNLNNGKWESL